MNTGLMVLSGILLLLGVGCLWFWKKFRDEIAVMNATPTSRAADVAALAPGTITEVKGVVRCDAPLTGEFSQRRCVYYKAEIEREEKRWRDGKREIHTVTEYSSERHAPFHVEDASGRVLVRGEGASVEALEVFSRSGNSAAEDVVSIATSLMGQGSQDRHMKESAIEIDTAVYVLGTVGEDGVIGAAPRGAAVKEFIITHKTEEERAQSSRMMEIIMMGAAVAFFIAAAVVFYYSRE